MSFKPCITTRHVLFSSLYNTGTQAQKDEVTCPTLNDLYIDTFLRKPGNAWFMLPVLCPSRAWCRWDGWEKGGVALHCPLLAACGVAERAQEELASCEGSAPHLDFSTFFIRSVIFLPPAFFLLSSTSLQGQVWIQAQGGLQ